MSEGLERGLELFDVVWEWSLDVEGLFDEFDGALVESLFDDGAVEVEDDELHVSYIHGIGIYKSVAGCICGMFVGVDLAWSRGNESGVAVLSDGDPVRVENAGFAVSDEDILDIIPDETKLVAVDAPLVVPNDEGQRPAEDELRPVYHEYNAGPYPANRNWLEKMCGEVRGENFVDVLRDEGFEHNPHVDHSVEKGVLEVYPHPAMVALFELDTVIPYKDKQGRSKQDQVDGLRRFHTLLGEETRLVKSSLPDFTVSAEDTKAALKRFEDILDGVLSAYIAWFLWHNSDRVRVFGSQAGGYITSPTLPKHT